MRLHADHIAVDIDGATILTDGVVHAESGSVVGLLGPNGSGKSTLLRTLYRALAPTRGTIVLGDDDLRGMSARESARRSAVVLQDDSPEFEFTAREIVELGRIPHTSGLRRFGAADAAAVDSAVIAAGIAHLVDRQVSTLSGGERQRVFVARALAQQSPILILDEPTNHLDISAQIDLLELLTAATATVVVALHDIDLAAAYCDHLYLMKRGALAAHGTPADVLTAELLREIYGVDSVIGTNPLTHRPCVHFGPAARLNTSTPDLDTSTSSERSRP
ncbi:MULTISPECIES: ABC transporter ATP-binding protein [Nocardiaceae]|uniref:Iron complex transport system ATP-binding protein n=1 Tax=Rhodococcoides corynebacterioides TaxID=53972 RepID=A0ABS2KQ80_9NOCA|nr:MULTISPECIES: ABC transporter ATP-binding protein [Rhodococcus]MBM7413446.1 iron complex transport system ATP-binding protein [Rhodococcus corynebacterioides]MBP1115909.1 iron complex transport system ATP-binding protein [Rhodococcus sp. PvP016]